MSCPVSCAVAALARRAIRRGPGAPSLSGPAGSADWPSLAAPVCVVVPVAPGRVFEVVPAGFRFAVWCDGWPGAPAGSLPAAVESALAVARRSGAPDLAFV